MKRFMLVLAVLLELIAPAVIWGLTDDDVKNLVGNANVAMFKHNYQQALSYCDQALEEKPDFAVGYAIRSAAKLNLKDLNGAREDADQAMKLDPENKGIHTAYYVQSVIANNFYNEGQALKFINKAIEMTADDPVEGYYEFRAEINDRLGNKQAADDDYAAIKELFD